MRKLCVLIALALLAAGLTGCSLRGDPSLEEFLPGHTGSSLHWQEAAFQDSTDYAEVYYEASSDAAFAASELYRPVTEADLEELNPLWQDHAAWIAMIYASKGYDWYTFRAEQADLSDYVCYRTEYTDEEGYISYDIYFYDTGSHTLYFFHNNI